MQLRRGKEMNILHDIKKITRFEVIDKTGRAYVKWDCKIKKSIQDNGKTLKIFVEEVKP